MMHRLYPLLFQPAYQHYMWGGDEIIRRFHRNEPPGVYAESWEVSDRPEGMSVVRNGPLQGEELSSLIQRYGSELLGVDPPTDRFPLLIKLIDARETLSVQVHPDDETAQRYGGEAKTEMWYVLDAAPGACVYAGLKSGADEAAFRQGVEAQTLDALLEEVSVQAGDVVFMPGGRVHAIGAGSLLLEVQQNSNTTYRIYDWGRVGSDGTPRDLHLEQAIRVMRWQDNAPAKIVPRRLESAEPNERWELLACPLFRMERLTIRQPWSAAHDGRSFQILFAADAPLELEAGDQTIQLPPGTTCLIPAAVTKYQLRPDPTAPATVLRITG